MTETIPRESPPEGERRGPRLPQILGPWETLVLLWRRLRRMSTALLLLFTLAVASLIATFIPQEPVIPTTVAQWRTGAAGPGETISQVFDALDLYDVFGSTWFAVLTGLLFTSLTGCLIPRFRAFARVVRRPPGPGRNFDRLTHRVILPSALPPEAALDALTPVLRRYRTRRLGPEQTGSGHPQLAVERGHWREGGSLLFHVAFYVLLLGVIVAEGFGFTGQVNLVEGAPFTDTRVAYDLAEPGRWFGLEDHAGTRLELVDFDVQYFDDLTPKLYRSRVRLLDDSGTAEPTDITVNHPLTADGLKVYQMRFGMAPRIMVRSGETVILDEQVMFSEEQGGIWRGTAKVATGEPQMVLDMVFLPDARLQRDSTGEEQIMNGGPRPENPVLFADLWVGELGLERPLPARDFTRSGGELVNTVMVREGETVPLAGQELDLQLSFPQLTMWSGFQISHAPGRWLLVLASVLLLAGLVPSLYSYRRRIWAEARLVGEGSEVVLAGVALQRKQEFAGEFARLAGRTADRLTVQEEDR